MLQIRKNVFETNSSSTHSFTVDKITGDLEKIREDIQVLMDDKDIYYAEKLLNHLIDLVKEYDDTKEGYEEW